MRQLTQHDKRYDKRGSANLARKKDRAKAPRAKARPNMARSRHFMHDLYPDLNERQRAILSCKEEWRMPGGEPYPKISAADRKPLVQALAAEIYLAQSPQSEQQRFVAHVEALRAQGKKKAVEQAAAKFGISRRTAYDWLKRRRV